MGKLIESFMSIVDGELHGVGMFWQSIGVVKVVESFNVREEGWCHCDPNLVSK